MKFVLTFPLLLWASAMLLYGQDDKPADRVRWFTEQRVGPNGNCRDTCAFRR
jgi:hypothetical protein